MKKIEVIKKVKKNLEDIKDLEIDIESLKKQREALITDNIRFLNLTDWGRNDNDSRTITLKKKVPSLEVTATDISKEALQVAAENASSHGLDIRFLEGDLLEPVSLETFDCILSNPPYVGRQEEHLMDESVLKYEPHSALFADHEGLCIYERLAYELPFYLKTDGCLFMEIGFQQGDQLLALYKRAFPDKEVSIQKDINGLDRMLIVI